MRYRLEHSSLVRRSKCCFVSHSPSLYLSSPFLRYQASCQDIGDIVVMVRMLSGDRGDVKTVQEKGIVA
jgi:hypothetical protein